MITEREKNAECEIRNAECGITSTIHSKIIVAALLGVLTMFVSYPVAAEPLGKRIVLDNGMVLLLSEKHDIPMVTINMALRAGSTSVPADKPGLASLTASLLTQGTTQAHRKPDPAGDRFYRRIALDMGRRGFRLGQSPGAEEGHSHRP